MDNAKELQNITILAVDDDPFILKLIQKSLSTAGFTNVLAARNGREALEAMGHPDHAETHDEGSGEAPAPPQVDIVVLDVVLPDLGGFELCRMIKEKNPKLPVVLISGYDIQDINTKIIETGADDFLTKPFTPAELVTRIKLVMGRTIKAAANDQRMVVKGKMQKSYNLPYIGDKIDNYMIIDFIGWGRTSVIYKVINPDDKSVYALKMLTTHAAEISDAVKRFENEMLIMAKVVHPNVIRYYSSGMLNKCPYLIMEYIDGMDLEEYLVTRGKVPGNELKRFALDVAAGVSALHKCHIVHRDIKLKNILFEYKTGNAKISDFGIAKMPESMSLTRDGFVIGTPLYMAPEVLYGDNATFLADIYSFGATLYHLTAGLPPFRAEDSAKLYEKIKTSNPLPITHARSDISPLWNELIVEGCLAKDPADRPASMDEVIARIEQIKEE